MPMIPALMAERVEMEQLSTATGVANMGLYLGAAIGPWSGGIIYDISGSYLWALILGAAMSITALIIVLTLPGVKQHKSV